MSSPTGNEILISQRDRVTKKLGLLTKTTKNRREMMKEEEMVVRRIIIECDCFTN